jgi:hypothetical protein
LGKETSMTRNGLLITTAIIVVGTLSFFAVQSATLARTVTAEAARDKNREFLCTYGGIKAGDNKHAYTSSYFSSWSHVAVAIKGRGRTVHRIFVKEAPSSDHYTSFKAGIYSNTPSGIPGRRLAGGIGHAKENCGLVKISIPTTDLALNTTYWVEESVSLSSSEYTSIHHVYWAVAPNTKKRAYIQTRHFSSYNSSLGHSTTSPWIEQGSGPWVRVN